ncbi:MAG: caspase family protein [Crocinitomicaceae bacterium]|nr:caspase family protein [Crocinitomicaceae bacterium]
MKIFTLFITLLISWIGFSQEHFLRVNPKGHQGMIRDLVITKDGEHVLTGSFDKSVKKWNLKTGVLETEFRSYIGVGSEGMIYHIALSPDNKYLATTGWFGADDESEIVGDIRVFNFETGKMAFVLRGLNNTSTGLAFSADSKYLVAGDTESKVLKWELATQKIVGDFSYHSTEYGKELHRIACNGKMLVTAGWDGKLCLFDLEKPGNPIKEDKKFFQESLLDNIGALAISKDGSEIAVALNHFIIIYDGKLKPYFVIENKEKPGFLKFSEDGTRLLTGSIKSGKGNTCYVFEKNGKDWVEFAKLKGHDNSIIAGDFINHNEMVTAGGEENEICYWKLNGMGNEATIERKIVGVGQEFFASALDEESLALASKWTANFGMSILNQKFDLFEKTKENLSNDEIFPKPIQNNGTYEAETYNEGGYSIVNPKLILKKNGTPIDTIIREYWNGSRHNAYTFAPNGMIISGGSQGIMAAYDMNGFERNYFVGHEGDIWSTTISKNGERLVTCGSDQTIRIWSLDKLGKDNPDPDMKSVWDYLEFVEVSDVYHPILKSLKLEESAKIKSYEAWQKVIDGLREKDYPADFLETKLYFYKSQIIYPIASIFIANNGEWIIWNEDGYFSASKKGAQLVGYHMNQKKDQEAKFYPFGQFDLKYNRPDIILRDLAVANENMIDFYYQAYIKRLKKFGMTEEQLSGDIHLPDLEVVSYEQVDKKLKLEIQAEDSKYKLDRFNIYINDVPIFGAKGKKLGDIANYKESLEIDLPEGNSFVEVSVINNKGAESLRENLSIHVSKSHKPNLYLVCIGASDYQNDAFDLKYASKDAKDLKESFLNSTNYEKINYKLLVDEEVTKENIAEIKSFVAQAGIDDVVILFIAGHGVLDENLDYYYATHDMDFNNPEDRGVSYAQIETLLDGLKAIKKVLFMDTCHSGEVDKEDVEIVAETNFLDEDITFRNAGANVRKKDAVGLKVSQEMVKELFADVRRGTGATVISSAGGAEYAMESESWKNGLFTFCLLDALKNGSGDLNKDQKLMLSEVQNYLQRRVEKLSKGRQVPTSRIENISLDFQLK